MSKDKHALANRLLVDGVKLFEKGTAQSLLQALTKFEDALSLFQALEDKKNQAFLYTFIAGVYKSLGKFKLAISPLSKAISLYHALGDKKSKIYNLNIIGGVYSSLGENEKALDYFEQALSLSSQLKYKKEQALTLSNLGVHYQSIREYEKALESLKKALSLKSELEDSQQDPILLNNLGLVYHSLGENQKALDYYKQALSIFISMGSRSKEASVLNSLGAVYDTLGETQKAFNCYNKALKIFGDFGIQIQKSLVFNNLGLLYSSVGEFEEALKLFKQAHEIHHDAGMREREATNLTNIGHAYNSLGKKEKALANYEQALSIYRQLGHYVSVAQVNNYIVSIEFNSLRSLLSSDDLPLQRDLAMQRLTRMARALGRLHSTFSTNQDPFVKISIHRNEGLFYFSFLESSLKNGLEKPEDLSKAQSHFNTAISHFNTALSLSSEIKNNSLKLQIFLDLARVKVVTGNQEEALKDVNSAIELCEQIRIKITSPEHKTTYFTTVESIYKLRIRILMDLHKRNPNQVYVKQAFQTSEKSKARSLLELLTESNINIRRGVDAELIEQENHLQQRLEALEKRHVEILSNINPNTKQQAAAINKQIKELIIQYKHIQNQIRVVSPAYAALTQPEPVTMEDVQQKILDKDTVLLQYSLTEEYSYLWVVTTESFNSVELPPASEIDQLADRFYLSLINGDNLYSDKTRIAVPKADPSSDSSEIAIPKVNPSPDSSEIALKLSQILLGEIAPQLNKKRIVVVADGSLHYVPFAALPNPHHLKKNNLIPLINDYEVVNLPSCSTLAILREEKKQPPINRKKIAILADPVFSPNDERFNNQQTNSNLDSVAPRDVSRILLQRAAKNVNQNKPENTKQNEIKRLRGTRKEAEAILKLIPESEQISAFDFAANRNWLTQSKLAEYAMVHIATHGMADSTNPELSGLILSLVDEQGKHQNGYFRLHDVFNLNLAAELVVLSACQTGLGKNFRGEGLVGLTRGFMYAGTPRVLVSLWSVDDNSTAEMMQRFYRLILKDGLTPAEALRAAQIEMQTETEWKSPYYWAAFTLQGEWQRWDSEELSN